MWSESAFGPSVTVTSTATVAPTSSHHCLSEWNSCLPCQPELITDAYLILKASSSPDSAPPSLDHFHLATSAGRSALGSALITLTAAAVWADGSFWTARPFALRSMPARNLQAPFSM